MSKEDAIDQITDFYQSIALQHREPEGPKATGECLFCGEQLHNGARWCDAQCRDDWEKSNS